jgi:hypothetical protein
MSDEIKNYKGYKIVIKKQHPSFNYSFRNFSDDNQDPNEIYGSHNYQILDDKNKIIFSDNKDLWDSMACFENACQDIDSKLFDIENKTITLTSEEHSFLVEELGENRNRFKELLEDEIISIENNYLIKGIKSNIEGYKKEIRLCDSILKKL